MSRKPESRTWQVLEILNWSADHLRNKGFENARVDAELLLGHALGARRIDLYLQFDRRLTQAETDRYRDALKQRLQRVPVQYILGNMEFYSLCLSVNEAVFIPRPETEILVEAVLRRLAGGGRRVVADVGTGSGAIAIALAHEMPDVNVYATECCARALEAATANACRHGVADRIRFLEGDLLEPLSGLGDRLGVPCRMDAIVSNPPYVRTDAIGLLPEEIKDHEPRLALDGGPDGLAFHRRLAAESPEFLRPGGVLALEVGDGQADAVAELLGRSRLLGEVQRVQDLNGVVRVLLAERSLG